MAFYDQVWYCNAGNQSSTGYYAVPQFAASHAYSAGQLIRQLTTPAVGSERVFVCIVAGTSGTEPTWTVTRGAKNTSTTPVFQECTGASAVNGDQTNTPTWAQARAINTAVTLGAIIQRNNGASYWICSTAGSVGASEPSWANDTAGTTQTDSTVTWTCLGVVGNFSGGGAPHARVANACATNWFAAGNTLYVGDNHAESQTTAITITPAGSGTVPSVGKILCHNHAGNYPPTASDLTTGATISTTAAVAINFNPGGATYYIYGIAFIAGAGASSGTSQVALTANTAAFYFDNCLLKNANTSAGLNNIQLNTTASGVVIWNNCTVYFGNVGHYIDIGTTNFIWQNTGQILASGSSVPTGLMAASAAGRLCTVVLEALDLSQLTGAIDKQATTFEMGNWFIKDCKLNASMTIPIPLAFGQTVQLVRSDSGATAYKSARYAYEGTETTETSITRVGGATDPTGQAQSRKIVTTANVQWLRPFKAEPYAIWNSVTGSNVTVTVCGTINAGLPNNDDIWMEVEYLGSSASPLGTIVNTTKANLLAANAAVASDSSSWNNLNFGFDPTTTTNTTLSNNNLTATHSNTTSNSGARISSYLSTGKYYFEIMQATTGHGGSDVVGALFTAANAFSDLIGASNCIIVSRTGGIATAAGSTGQNIGVFSAGDVLGMAVDLDARLFWARRNAGNWNNSGTANPATGVGGFVLTMVNPSAISSVAVAPAVGFLGAGTAVGDAYTANFGAASYANAAPSGFGNWIMWSPFKLTTTLSSPQPGLAGYLYARVRAAKPSTTYYVDPKIVLS